MNATRSFTTRREVGLRATATAIAVVLVTAVAVGSYAAAASTADHSSYAPGGGSARSAMLIR